MVGRLALADDFLEPISDTQPAGEDLSASAEYAEIEGAYRDADVPADLVFMDAGDTESDFSDVVARAEDFLGRSKDIHIATYLTAALLRQDGFEGLADGLELLYGLMDRFWDDLHPDPGGRSAVLGWLGGDDPRGTEPLLRVSYVVQLTPLTEERHTFLHYREWKKMEDEGEADVADADAEVVSAATFGPAMNSLTWDWCNELCESIDRCGQAVERLGDFEQKFKDAGTTPPRYKDLADALKRVGKAAEDLRSRKPAPAPAELPADESAEPGESESPVTASAGSAAAKTQISEPRTAGEAALAIGTAARVLRKLRPTDPTSYLLVRAFRFGELRALGEDPDPTAFAKALAAPTTQQRTHLKTLFLDEEWADLLETAEKLAAEPTGRGWLDLHRYVALAADRLGSEYELVSQAVKTSLERLLEDVPNVLNATLMDDVSTASRDTREWLQVQGLLDGVPETGTGAADGSVDTDAGRAVREASFSRAAAMVRAGDAQGAIELLLDRAEHESSERERFITRSEALAIMLDNGMKAFALPTLKELNELVARHSLEEWEPPEVVAKPLTLLYRCLDEGVPMKQELHDRLARLDPVFFMQATRRADAAAARGSGRQTGRGAGGPEEAGSGEPEPMAADRAQELLDDLEADLDGDDS